MDTTKKGDKLEYEVFEFLKSEIEAGRFLCSEENCKIHRKKGYYSKDREKDIVFDISIEIYWPGQETYSILVLVECKNYNHRVPVDDLEEFYAKTQQISAANTKAILVSNNAFQEGAFNFSKSKGIGLLRYVKNEDLDWVLTRSPSSLVSTSRILTEWSGACAALYSQEYEDYTFDCYGFVGDIYTNSLSILFSTLIKLNSPEKIIGEISKIENIVRSVQRVVPYVEMLEIEKVCDNVRVNIGYQNGKVSLDSVCKYLEKDRGLRVYYASSLSPGVLGQIKFSPLEIYLNNKHKNISRMRFTLAHELGHLLLDHSKYMGGEKCRKSSIDLDGGIDVGIADIQRMEWQANQFASCLLLPKAGFTEEFAEAAISLGISNRGFGPLFLDTQRCNISNYHNVTSILMRKFGVSRSVVKLRLVKLGLLNEVAE